MYFLHLTSALSIISTAIASTAVHRARWSDFLVSTRRVRTYAAAACLCFGAPAFANTDYGGSSPLSDSQWEIVRQRVGLLDKIAYLPSLLPVVMQHRDTLVLSDAQVEAFREWRKTHYQEMVDLMNQIIQLRISLSETTLDAAVSGDEILSRQSEIFRLQEQLLRIRLSCRRLIVETFTPDQWENFAFILEDYPRYAGLLRD